MLGLEAPGGFAKASVGVVVAWKGGEGGGEWVDGGDGG